MSKVVVVLDVGEYVRGKKDKLSKQIMETVEKHYKDQYGTDYRSRRDFAEIRSCVFDGINELYRDFCLIMSANDDSAVVIENGSRGKLSHSDSDQHKDSQNQDKSSN